MRNILKTGVALLVLCHVPMGSLANDNNATPSPDFDGDGTVGFPDFLLFGDVFGSSQGDEGYKARFDLDGDGTIGFSDFLIFVDSFGGIFIPDANLRAAIAAALGKAGGASITVAEMKTLNRLHAPEAGINDLTGLESATSLTRLYLTGNNITDISPLAGLANLEILNLAGNGITDISPLVGLTSLESLLLGSFSGNNNITDISPLAGLSNLTRLALWSRDITDISPLAGLVNLTDIALFRVRITNQAALASLLTGRTNLTRLSLGANGITDISPLARLSNLTYLQLSYNNITDISPLAGLSNLTRLELVVCDVTDISPLAGLSNLMELHLSYNNITDISPVAGLANLEILGLPGNGITDISPLVGLTSLESLNLADNNNITDISPLASLTSLERLNFRNNDITDISPLASMTNLEWLDFSINHLMRISALAGLANLTELFLEFNAISDTSPLSGLANLTELSLRGNPLNDTSINDLIPALQNRGVKVQYDSFREGDFDIELVFTEDFTGGHKSVLQYVARRWMAVIAEDLPDYEFTQGWSGKCGDQSFEIPSGERIDDLRIYMTTFEGGTAVGYGGPSLLREETHLPVLGCMHFDLKRANLLITGLHEIGHVLGFGPVWRDLGFRQDLDGDTHFNGPLAIAAFNDAGGRDYTGKKVPVSGGHWRRPVLSGELMVSGGGAALSAITVQSMADLGYGVDVTQADPYTLPGTSAGKASAKIAVATPAIPRVDVTQADALPGADPHWQGRVPEVLPSIFGQDHWRGRLESAQRVWSRGFDLRDNRLMWRPASPAETEPKLSCGVDLMTEPIYVINPQGYIIRTIGR